MALVIATSGHDMHGCNAFPAAVSKQAAVMYMPQKSVMNDQVLIDEYALDKAGMLLQDVGSAYDECSTHRVAGSICACTA